MPSRLRPIALCAVLSIACSPNVPPGGGEPSAKGLGEVCDGSTPCRTGLKCDPDALVCVGSMSAADGAACLIGPECQSGYCAPNLRKGQCAPAGMLPRGAVCKVDGECATGLKCSFDGETLFPRCVPAGAFDQGHACTSPRECAQGLYCLAGTCQLVPLPPDAGYPPVIPTPSLQWRGGTCPAEKKTGLTALFELPRDSDPEEVKQDFFRLPFPNDAARGTDGAVDFTRFPKDPNPPFGFDLLGRYLEVVKGEPFSNYPTVLFRFDGPVKFSGFTVSGAQPQTRLVELTPGARFGAKHGVFYEVSGGRNRYVCPNWFGLRPYTSDALLPGTFAVVLLKGIKAEDDDSDVQSAPDFQALLDTSTPTDAKLAAAWPAYAPLRAYLAMEGIAPTSVLVASVFTVGDGTRLMTALAATAATGPLPLADPWVKCGSGAPSPCPDVAGARACGSSADFDEWHTLIDLPIFQQGTAPYMSPDAGGDIDPDAGVVRHEKVCAALTTPKGAAPPGGWPVVLYAHGTGGSFRSHASDGSGAALARVDLDGGTADGGALPGGYAVLGFDQVGHGPRRGARTDLSPEDIVFNFANPASARGTMAQGATDLLGVARLVKALDAADAGLPALDSSRLTFWGHSQGATEGAMFLANDRSVEGALLSGASASVTDALLSKRAPIDIADSMWIALGESAPTDVDLFHPVLTLLQGWTDPVDPINFARNVVVVPAVGATAAHPRHLLQIWGKGDTFTARPVQNIFALAAGLAFVGPKVDETDLSPVTEAFANVAGHTAAMRQYDPMGAYDGHFVVFQDPGARRDAVRFLVRSASGDAPRVPEP
jgi:hypothetical protein